MNRFIKKYTLVTISIAVMSVAVNMFLGPFGIAAGGLTGLSIVLERLIPIDRAVIILIGNALVILLALIFLERETFYATVYGAAILPLFIAVIPQTAVLRGTMQSMIVGSVIFGVGVSILFRYNASSGGTAVPPLIFKKYFGLKTSLGLFIMDGFVVLFSLFVFSLDIFFYAIFSIFITMTTMRYIESGLSRKKMVYIISESSKEIREDVMSKIGRGVTIIPAIGAYKETPLQMLMVTLSTRDYRKLLPLVKTHDSEAFMITDTVTDVHGEGFTYESGSV